VTLSPSSPRPLRPLCSMAATPSVSNKYLHGVIGACVYEGLCVLVCVFKGHARGGSRGEERVSVPEERTVEAFATKGDGLSCIGVRLR
jgi:hypothetical protein